MRIEELHLERFGHFDGFRLDLSGDGVLLHVIHGPNEAGKSTALTAICDLLFGMPERTPYNFLYPYGALRIGATLSNVAGQRLRFKRRKARENTLLTPDEDGTLPDGSLAPYLGGATREFFERMYGLNHERLRAGGRAMLQADGDVARSLFEAGGGTAGLSAVVKALADEADAIGSPARRSASKPYWRAHDRYDEATRRMKAEALRADAWNAAQKAVADAEARREDLQKQLSARRRERSGLERVRRVAPILKRIDGLSDRLAALGDGVPLPEGFAETWRQAMQAAQEANGNVARISEDLDGLRKDLQTLGDPGIWPSMAKRIDDLAIGLGAYRAKCNDLPHRVRDLEAGRDRVSELLRQLGADIEPERAGERAPSTVRAARVRALVADWNRLDQKLLNAKAEAEQAAIGLREAEDRLREAGTPRDPAGAAAAVEAALVHGDATGRLVQEKRDLEAAEEDLSAAMSALGRWTKGADALAGTAFPSSDSVLRMEETLRRLEADREDIERERERLRGELNRLDGEIAALQAVGEVPTEDALRAAREHRDHGWRLIRRRYLEGAPVPDDQLSAFAPDGDVADAFEGAVAAADQMADGREREAGRVERFAACTGQREKVGLDLGDLNRRAERLLEHRRDWEAKWATLWRDTGIAPGTPTEMRGWLARKDEALARHQAVRVARRAVELAEDEEAQVRTHLLAAAAELGIGDADALAVPSLRQRVTNALGAARARWDEAATLERAAADRRRQDGERRAAVARIEASLEDWRSRWTKEMPGLGLPADAGPMEAEAALNVWQEIGRVLTDMAQTRHRHAQMKDAIDAYEEEVRAVLCDLGDAVADLDADGDCSTVVPILQRRLGEAQQLSARIGDLTKRIQTAESALEDAKAKARSAAAEVRTLRELHGLPEDADVVALARDADLRRSLRASIDVERAALTDQGDGMEEDALRAAIAGVDMDVAAAEIERLDGDIGRLQEELEEAARTLAVSERALADLREREGIGVAAQEANDAAAAMVAHVERWLRLRTATVILNRAVERYREANQNPLVRRASEIFGAIAGTGDDPIVRLSVDYTDETKPVLVGYRRDGRACPVSGMSDGTLDQLYLALRIAAVEQHMASAEPLPFVADDLFITSDEDRTVPGVKALAELGRRTQVLLFTHHRYVVEAAGKALGSGEMKLHSLRLSASRSLELVE